ncbi:MAG TPA: hypothetical protein PKZ77_06745 [Pseudomonadales bacterium]|nr:hypothetical protein [Pseudomonadales bacterium]HNC70166.1 hypothetical protein [Pseudomonadales bacterium]
MDESLRLAYLAAMEIPVWVLRGAVEAECAEEAEAAPAFVPPVTVSAPAGFGLAPGRLAQELLGPDSQDRPVTGGVAAAARTRGKASSATVAGPIPALLLVMAGRHLFIDEAGDAQRDARVAALAAAIAFALNGERVAASMQRFDPVASGVAPDRAGARDVLLGWLTKLTESMDPGHLILLGPAAAGLLLGWDERAYAQRVPLVQRVVGLQVGALVTLAADSMLGTPELKRDAWRELCAARAAHGD